MQLSGLWDLLDWVGNNVAEDQEQIIGILREAETRGSSDPHHRATSQHHRADVLSVA
jgi:hypothetical protein